MVQIVVHQLVPETNQKKIRPEKKGTVVWPMEAAQIWRERYNQKKKVQSSGQLCFLAGSNYNQKKLQPEKKGTVESSDRPFFPAGSNYNQKKLQPEKKGTVESSDRPFFPAGSN